MYSVIDRYAADLKQLFTVVGKRIIQLTDIIHAAAVTSCSASSRSARHWSYSSK